MIDYTIRELKPSTYHARTRTKPPMLAIKLIDDYMEGYAENEQHAIDYVLPMLRLLRDAPQEIRGFTSIHPNNGYFYINLKGHNYEVRTPSGLRQLLDCHARGEQPHI